ncbi:MAG TPA: LysM peptidoglycan-binding domain-containing protein, partial [Polyangiaceae bacterium]|nr:LysM peptidoglycan-binding domain-containing protein [Polyangiaceae bacterium]
MFRARFSMRVRRLAIGGFAGLIFSFTTQAFSAERGPRSQASVWSDKPAEPSFEATESSTVPAQALVGSGLTASTPIQVASGVQVVAQLFEDSPEVAVCTAVLAGSAHDQKPGVHRLLAEILRDGGYRSGAQDYLDVARARGAENEVQVYPDATVYCTRAPRAELELAVWLAAGRFSSAAINEATFKEKVGQLAMAAEQRDAAVFEGRAQVRLRRMAFLGEPALGAVDLPSPEYMDAITLEDLKRAHEQAYVARRAVVALVGGGTIERAQQAAHEYLERIRPGTEADAARFQLVTQQTLRFSMDEDRAAKTPAAWYGWVIPTEAVRSHAHAALALLMNESRLSKQISSGSRPAKRITLYDPNEPTRFPTLARIEVVGRYPHALGLIEKELSDQLRLLATTGPTPQELTQYAAQLAQEERACLATAQLRAATLARGLLHGFSSSQLLLPLGPEYLPAVPSADQIKAAALTLLIESRRNVVEVYPKGWQDPWQAPMPAFHIVEKGQTLSSIAVQYGTTIAVLTKMNNIKQVKPIYPGDKLKVPRGKAKAERPARTHQVRRGDTLSGIAIKYGVKVRDIAAANGMGARQTIRAGETLNIPWPSSNKAGDAREPAKSESERGEQPDAGRHHTVKSGETLSEIARGYGLSTVALARENGLSHKALVKVGQKLKLPASSGSISSNPQSPTRPSFSTYRVKSGDTLSGIAHKHHISVAELAAAN